MDDDAFVPLPAVNTYGLEPFQLGKDIEVILDEQGRPYIRAIYGWKGPVAMRAMYGQFVPYSGDNNIFCMSHSSLNGLGELNVSRRINLLETPDRCANKGVRAFVNISEARRKGIEFWSRIGDRYGNKIYCFDPKLNENFFNIEYNDKYRNEEVLKITHAASIEKYSKRFGSHEKAIEHVRKLIISEEESEEESD
jgi:hypothetical protein